MKASFRIVTPAAALSAAAAALLLSGCADKPVRVPGGAFYEEPYQGETSGAGSQLQAQPSDETVGGASSYETEIIYIENDVPVGPVEQNGETASQGQAQGQSQAQGQGQSGQQDLQPVETTKSNVPEGSVEYKVVKGDTLWGIGMVYGVSVQRLAEINGIDEKAPLRVGQVLMIPPDAKNAVGKPIPQKKADQPKTATSTSSTTVKANTTKPASTPAVKEGEKLYVVKSGDSLSVIAQRHHVKLADLIAANKVDPKATLRIGQTLVIPAATASAATTTKTDTKTATTTKTTETKPATTTTKPAATTTTTTKPADTNTKPATTTPAASSSSTPSKGGEGTGGIVEPIGGSSSGVTAPATTTPAGTPAASSGSAALPALDPVSEVPDLDVISVPIDSELTIEEVANIHDRNLQDLIWLNPDFKPGQKIPAGTTVRMPLF